MCAFSWHERGARCAVNDVEDRDGRNRADAESVAAGLTDATTSHAARDTVSETITYRALHDHADRLAARLRARAS